MKFGPAAVNKLIKKLKFDPREDISIQAVLHASAQNPSYCISRVSDILFKPHDQLDSDDILTAIKLLMLDLHLRESKTNTREKRSREDNSGQDNNSLTG